MAEKEQPKLPFYWIPGDIDPLENQGDEAMLETINCPYRSRDLLIDDIIPENRYYCTNLKAGEKVGLLEYCSPAQINKRKHAVYPFLREAVRYKKLQEKQPDRTTLGCDEHFDIRKHWVVKRSDYGEREDGTGTIIFGLPSGVLRLEKWEEGERIKAFIQ